MKRSTFSDEQISSRSPELAIIPARPGGALDERFFIDSVRPSTR